MNVDQIYEICAKSTQEIVKIHDALLSITEPNWEDTPQWKKDVIDQWVSGICMSYMEPEKMHIIWTNAMTTDGWVYDTVFDELNKKHPYLMEFSNLPNEWHSRYNMIRHVVSGIWTSLR